MRKWLLTFTLSFLAGQALGATASDFLGTWKWIARTSGGDSIDVNVKLTSVSGGVPAGTLNDHFGLHNITEAQVQGDTLKFTVYYDAPGIDDVPVWTELSLSGGVTTTKRNIAPNSGFSVERYGATHIIQEGGNYPVVTDHPDRVTATKSGAASFSIQATGASPMTYQWLKDGQRILGANSSTLNLERVSDSDAGEYACSVANSAGVAHSNYASLTVNGGGVIFSNITILSSPQSKTVNAGTATSLTVVATGIGPISYQWSKNTVEIPGATSSTLTIANTQCSDAGNYNCALKCNGSTMITYPGAVLTVVGRPSITLQPTAVAVKEGESFKLTTIANGGNIEPLKFRWYRGTTLVWGGERLGSIIINTGSGPINVVVPYPTPINFTCQVASSKASDAGEYYCVIENASGSTTTEKVMVTVQVTSKPPAITEEPNSVAVTEGKPLTLSTTATSVSGALRFHWHHNGVGMPSKIVGNTSPFTSTFHLPVTSSSDAGEYYCVIENEGGQVTTRKVTVVVERAARIVNLSSRAMTGGVAGTPISGFVIRGDGQLPVLVRAVGPTLGTFGVSAVVADPVLRVLLGDQEIGSNDNWLVSQSATFTGSGAFPLLAESKDAAAVQSLNAGSYTVMAQDALGRAGVLLAETYDSSPLTSNARFVNASTRGYVGTGEQSMFTGFVVMGKGTVRILVRAVGPTLKGLGVEDAIADPICELFNGTTKLGENDNWGSGPGAGEVAAAAQSVGAFALAAGSKDAAMVVDLKEGNYSVVTAGTNATTGTVLIELYLLP